MDGPKGIILKRGRPWINNLFDIYPLWSIEINQSLIDIGIKDTSILKYCIQYQPKTRIIRIRIHNPATNPGMASPLLRQMYRITSSGWAAKKQIGSGFSRKKTELGPDVSQFWNFLKSGKKSDPGQMGLRVQDIGQKTWSVYEINWQNKTKNLLFKTYYSSIIFIIYLIQIGHCKDWKKRL